MSEDPIPYATTPVPRMIRVGLATPVKEADRVLVPWQGVVLWCPEGGGFERICDSPQASILSKS